MTAQNQQRDYMAVLFDSFKPQKCLFRLTPLHREPFGILPKKAGLQTFLHSQAHCCGTVGDSHSSSQLIAAKRTFTGEGRGYASTFTLTLSRITMQRYNKEMKKVTF